MSAEPHLHSGSCPRSSTPASDGRLRRRARALTACAGSRLRLAAGRVGGDAGLALACALLDMIGADFDPVEWPVSELIALLDREAARDRQVARLLTELRELEDRISTLPTETEDEDIIRRPAV